MDKPTHAFSGSAIALHQLTKKYGNFTAVNGISLEIKQGEIFGLLGPNGAGKTTTLTMLATINKPTSGRAEIWGYDTQTQTAEVRRNIGMVFQDPSLDDELTAKENLDFHGRLYGLSPLEREQKTKELIKLVDLEDKLHQQVKTFSGGMKRRLEIARALMHVPKVLFLDEPTIGLDPQTRRKLWDYISHINKTQNLTIILTTHYMDEADALCTRIGIIDKGKMMALDSPKRLKEKLGGDIIELATDDLEKMGQLLQKEPYAKEVKPFDHHVNVVVQNGAETIPKIIALAQKNKLQVKSVTLKQPSLEDVFIHFTGHAIREQEADSAQHSRQMARFSRGR